MMFSRMVAIGLAISTGAIWLSQGASADQTYIVRSGDTLASIAERFYGTPSKWAVLYQANQDRIGNQPTAISVGVELDIPELGVPASITEAASPEQKTNDASADVSEVALSARANLTTLVDPSLPDGGAMTKIVTEAFRRAGYRPTVDFTDREIEQQSLLSASFPYPRDQKHEANYHYSMPIVDFDVRAYWHAGTPILVRNLADLDGMRVCGTSVVMALAIKVARDSGAGAFTSLEDVALDGCFRGLVDSSVDVVLAEPSSGASTTLELGIGQEIVVGSDIIELGSLHVLVPRFSSYGSAMIYRLNEALNAMRRSGEIDDLLSRQRQLPEANVANQPASEPAKPGHTPTM